VATTVTIGGQHYKKRSIFAVWLGLPFITLGVYHYVWWYKINNEARRFLGDASIRPAIAVLALIPGFILIVPPFVSIYRTAGRVRGMQQAAGLTNVVTPWIALALSFVFTLQSLYLQMGLNDIWDRHLIGPAAFPSPPSLPSSPPPSSALAPPRQ
jgi:ABC-type spermidine/putrescine transport system permease subunit II